MLDNTALAPIKDDYTFNARVMPLYGPNGQPVHPDIARAVVRDDTGETIATCGPAFKPVQHSEIVGPILSTLQEQGYELEQRNATRNSLYDLQGKKGAFVSSAFTDNGAVMRTDIILGDFIQPTGSTSYLEQGPDTMFFKVSVFNSHNAKLAVKVNTSYLRLLCMNGMTRPDFSANVYGKHTAGFSLDAMTRKISNGLDAMHNDADTFGKWAKTKIDWSQAEDMLKRTVAKLPNKASGEAHFSEPLVRKILDQFAREDQTVWGLYNAVTHWQTHSEAKLNANPLTTTIGREGKVAGMLKSKPWAELLAA